MSRSKALIEAAAALAEAKVKKAAIDAQWAEAEQRKARYHAILDAQRDMRTVYVNTQGSISGGSLADPKVYLPYRGTKDKPYTMREVLAIVRSEKIDTGQGGQVKLASLAKRLHLYDPAATRRIKAISKRIAALEKERGNLIRAQATNPTVDPEWLARKIAERTLAYQNTGGYGLGYEHDNAARDVERLEKHVAHLRTSAAEQPETCNVCLGNKNEREWKTRRAEFAKQQEQAAKESAA
jgi:hypothetical protein